MFDFFPKIVPDAEHLAHIFSTATAPTFFLGSVAAFASLMTNRMNIAVQRIQTLNSIADDDPDRAHLKSDLRRLVRRAELLKSGIFASLVAGVCATILLADLFMTEFLGLQYAYGAALLFLVSTFFLGVGLVRFAQEVRISLVDADKF